MAEKKRYLVTSALPYANGPIHFGHIAGAYLPADIFVRYLRLKGEDVVYICGTDEHGVAITINAEKQGTTPRKLVDNYHAVIKKTFDQFNISFDNFSRTSLPLHYEIAQQFFKELHNNGYIKNEVTKQYYCEHDKMFLPDRYVLGVCPKCGHENARGDECPACGAWLDALELSSVRCSICNNEPIVKETEHWFLQLQDIQPKLEAWLEGKTEWKGNVRSFVSAMLKEGLQPRPVTRDISWGIPVPIEGAEGKVLYVWFDAPIGYISSTVEWAQKKGEPELWKDYWLNPECKLIHFIGKDNIPFHTIVFPAMLMGSGKEYILPENVPANEFYNFEGRKFSTSNGWYIDMDDFFTKYGTDPARFAIIANAPENKDTEFTWHYFQSCINAELADSFGNFINRVLTFVKKYFDGKVPTVAELNDRDKRAMAEREECVIQVGDLISKYNFRKAADMFLQLSREGNRYFDEKAPWKSRKEAPEDCATALWVCLQLTVSLASMARIFIPETAEKIFSMLGVAEKLVSLSWDEGASFCLESGTSLGEPVVLFRKIEDQQINEELEKLQAMHAQASAKQATTPAKPLIEYEDFAKLDLRCGIIRKAEKVEKSNKLLRLQVDFGGELRQVIGGLGKSYKPEELLNKSVVAVYNLKPRKLMGEQSNGMLLAAESNQKLFLLQPDGDAHAGSEVS